MSTHDDDAFLSIYRATVGPLFGLTSAWTRGDRALAEEIVQETYLRAVRRWRDDGFPDCPEAWLRTVARNLLTSHFRRLHRDVRLEQAEETLPDSGGSSSDPLLRVFVGRALVRIGRARARLLHAFHVNGDTVAEIAARTGLSDRAVEGRLRRAREALARSLESGD